MQKLPLKKLNVKKSHGAAMMIFTLFVFFISMTIIAGISRPAIREFVLGKNVLDSKQAYLLAESGVEDVFYRIKNNKQLGASEVLVLGEVTATTATTTLANSDKQIVAVGNSNSYQRKIDLILSQGVGTEFNYGMQSGTGGVTLNNNSSIIGNLYSNGPISGSGSITGTAISATASGSISGVTIGSGGAGDAKAHTVTNTTVAGTIYCQAGSGNNKACNTSQPDPLAQEFAVSDEDIADWKAAAVASGTSGAISLSGSSTQSIGPKKITGNATLSNSAVLTVTGTLWITGNVTISNSSIIKLSSTFGGNGGVIVVDGTVTTSNSATFQGSGTTGSYIMLVSTSTSTSAIEVSNTAGSIILVAPNGTVVLSNNAGANQVTAKNITLNNNATITYNSGLIDASFSSGPSGAWKVKSWQESE